MRKTLILAIVLVLGATFAHAQQSVPAEGTTLTFGNGDLLIQPLDVVTESAPVALDITDTTARVNFIGTEALACYLVYGTDETYGGVTNDPDMAQAAIIEHNPVLFDLEPDTEYVYRMQGVGEDGVMYVSEVFSFRTLPADISGTDNILALENGARVNAVSSNFGDGPNDGRWGVYNALDGNEATEWSSNGDGNDAFFEIELAETYAVDELQFQTRSMSDGTAIVQSFVVTTDLGETFGPFEVPTIGDAHTYAVDFTARVIRFSVEESTGGNVGAVDVAAFGEPVE